MAEAAALLSEAPRPNLWQRIRNNSNEKLMMNAGLLADNSSTMTGEVGEKAPLVRESAMSLIPSNDQKQAPLRTKSQGSARNLLRGIRRNNSSDSATHSITLKPLEDGGSAAGPPRTRSSGRLGRTRSGLSGFLRGGGDSRSSREGSLESFLFDDGTETDDEEESVTSMASEQSLGVEDVMPQLPRRKYSSGSIASLKSRDFFGNASSDRLQEEEVKKGGGGNLNGSSDAGMSLSSHDLFGTEQQQRLHGSSDVLSFHDSLASIPEGKPEIAVHNIKPQTAIPEEDDEESLTMTEYEEEEELVDEEEPLMSSSTPQAEARPQPEAETKVETEVKEEPQVETEEAEVKEPQVLPTVESYSTVVPQELEPVVDVPEGRVASVKLAQEAAARLKRLQGTTDVRDSVDVWKKERYCHSVFRNIATSKATMNNPCLELWETPDACALKMTYNEMHKVAQSVAAWVTAACGDKTTKNQIICVYLPRSLGMMSSVIGSFYCGCGVAVVDTKLPWSRLEFIVKDADAGVLITDSSLAGETGGFACPILDIAACLPETAKKTPKPWLSENNPGNKVTIKNDFRYDSKLEDDDSCVVIYTSGSTGNPKGVCLQYGAFSNYACIEQVLTIPSAKDRIVQTQSLSFIAGFHECWRALCGGAVLVMANSKVTSLGPDLEQWLRDQEITVMKAVPSLLRSMLIGDRKPQLPKLRLLHIGGEAVTQDLVDLYGPGRMFLNTYGSTETCSNCVIGFCAPGDKHCTIGLSLPSFKALILEKPDANEETNKGELYLWGMSLAKGYLNLDDKTKEVFIQHPKFGRIYKTGDIVERLPDYGNCIVYRGRSDNQLKINGYRVELGEVEAKLNMIAVINEAAAVAVDNTIYAFATIAEGKELTVGDMKEQLKGFGLPFFAMPGRLMIVDKFPKTISGKLDRKVLKKQIEDANKEAAAAASSGDLNTPLGIFMSVFAEVLKCKVEPDDDFFNLGGDSGSAGQTIGLIRFKGEKIDLPTIAILDLYAHRTPKALAEHIEKMSASGADEVQDVLRAKRLPMQDKPNKRLFDIVTFFVALLFMLIDAFEVTIYFLIFWSSDFVIPVTRAVEAVEVPQFVGIFGLAWKMLVIKLIFYVVWIGLSIFIKWTVIGRYREGRWAKFGPMHLRHWIVVRAASHMPWRLIGGTGISTYVMRAFGAKVGEAVFTYWEPASGSSMTGYDLYTLEDFSAICQGAYCSPIYFNEDSMVCGRVHLERFASLYPRSTASGNVHLQEGAVLDSLSSVTDGAILGAWEFWSGSLASCVGEVDDPMLPPRARPGESIVTFLQIMDIFFGYFFVVCVSMIPRYGLLVYLNVRDITLVTPQLFVGSVIISVFFGSIALTCFSILFVRTASKLCPSKPGAYHVYSWQTLILWHKLFWFKSPQLMLNNTRFLQWFAMACGMKMGEGSSISNVRGCIPDLVTIGETTFLANPTFLGVPVVQNGMFHVGRVNIGDNVLAGNNSFFPINCNVPNDTTIAVNTSCPDEGAPSGGIWVGHPAQRISDNVVTPHPHGKLHDRFFMFMSEVMIVFIPAIFFAFTILTWLYLWVFLVHTSGLIPDNRALQALFGGILLLPLRAFWAIVAGLFAKVTLSGFTRVPVTKEVGFWDPLCYRWRIYHKVWAFFVIPTLLKDFSGCIWTNRLINLLTMAEIEEDVLIVHHGVFRDHDFVRVRKGATINESCIFRTHTFEDWILKFGFVDVGPKSVVMPSTTLMFGVVTAENCTILANSLLLKGDKLSADTIVAGIPAAPKKNIVPEGLEEDEEEPLVVGTADTSEQSVSTVADIETGDNQMIKKMEEDVPEVTWARKFFNLFHAPKKSPELDDESSRFAAEVSSRLLQVEQGEEASYSTLDEMEEGALGFDDTDGVSKKDGYMLVHLGDSGKMYLPVHKTSIAEGGPVEEEEIQDPIPPLPKSEKKAAKSKKRYTPVRGPLRQGYGVGQKLVVNKKAASMGPLKTKQQTMGEILLKKNAAYDPPIAPRKKPIVPSITKLFVQ
eukprot:CAMPEP_0172472556 /NCGR_PEP_ID=MMETSP1065-20121228/68396_1 /TAXON_ID=265537 /ORGANISM="Amphiprora paludosa, Strain CCMP125" /LENGTH=2003 /DNA_ID=CAMNT_0013230703 /DNA_START=85 /DNA_END=6096 /DNA_ORIENTATION=+